MLEERMRTEEERIELARELSLEHRKEASAIQEQADVYSVTMKHPFEDTEVLARHFGEIFPEYGITLSDWIQAQFVTAREFIRACELLEEERNKRC